MKGKADTARHLRRLKKAGFRPVSKFRLALARTAVFSPFRGGKNLMPRRLIKQIFWCGDNNKHAAIELSLATARLQAERGAVELSVSFFNLWGRSLPAPGVRNSHMFFADPLDEVLPQTSYFEKPAGARWCCVSIQRRTSTQRIGLVGKPKAVVRKGVSLTKLEEALAGRDRKQLQAHLDEARVRKDRKSACRILERMVFLEKRQEDIRLLRLISDIEETLSAHAGPQQAGPGASMFVYDRCLTSPYRETMPLSKWLSSETASMREQAGGRLISVVQGPEAALRLLAASVSRELIHISIDSFDEISSHDWIFDSDFNAILSSKSAVADI